MFEVLIFVVFATIIGIMFLFFGYPFFRVLLPVWAFFAGLVFGFNGIVGLMGASLISSSLALILGFVLGLVLAAVAYFAYELAVYIFGASVGYVLGAGLVTALGFDPGFLSTVAGLAGAVLLAVLFMQLKMPKFLIIVLTASAGAMAVITGLFVLFGRVPDAAGALQLTQYLVTGSWFWLMAWIALMVVGMGFQYMAATVNEDMTQKQLQENFNWEKEYPKPSKK